MSASDNDTIFQQTSSTGQPQKVLIAEDNEVVRKGLINFIEKWGYVPVETADGDKAWQLIEQNPDIRLAILDWNLPGLNGMELCGKIRALPAYIYVIMFSARQSTKELLTALTGGADDYLVKPSKPSLLRARLLVGRRILGAIAGNSSVEPGK